MEGINNINYPPQNGITLYVNKICVNTTVNIKIPLILSI